MGRHTYLWSIILLQLCHGKGESILACPVTMTNQTHLEEITIKESTQANFSYQLGSETSDTVNNSVFAIEIKLCENGSYHGVCRCRWLSEKNVQCKNQKNVAACDVHNSKMRFSFLVKRTYNDIKWELYRQDSIPHVIKLTTLQVTYPAKVTGLKVNGQEVNETDVIDENQEVIVSCSFINGKPPVSVRLLDQTGHTHSSTRNEQGTLTLSLGKFRCQDMWPTIRCESPGSELNRSVSVLGKCLPQFSYTDTPVLSLARVLKEGMTFRLKSATNNIRKCHMSKLYSQPVSRDVKCELSGRVPDINLTLLFPSELGIREGIWMLNVTTELGSSNITFVLINSTVQFDDQAPAMTATNNRVQTDNVINGIHHNLTSLIVYKCSVTR